MGTEYKLKLLSDSGQPLRVPPIGSVLLVAYFEKWAIDNLGVTTPEEGIND